ncbi:MAG: S24 family peptidase [Sphingobium sp.]
MDEVTPRKILEQLIAERGDNYGALSRLLGRNSAYIQQFIKRGTPRKLDESDRRLLAQYFGIDEVLLGGPSLRQKRSGQKKYHEKSGDNDNIALVPRFDLEASAGYGSALTEEFESNALGFDRRWLKRLGLQPENLSIIDVKGESMSPTLNNGDTIMVDSGDAYGRLRDGIYVLRLEDSLMVKRVSLSPRSGKKILTISSDNAHYPSWKDIDSSLVSIAGRVVWSSRLIL